ncbi:MAG TPA: hypothetical protein VHQ96_13090 [Gaiellaceae bacterium]|nr:hypothetical protein [Gaiellaceae bacterium]
MIIPARFNGPPGSANGGYAAGLFSEALGGGFEVTLLRPPPLDTQLEIVGDELRDGDNVVAKARRGTVPEDTPEPVSLVDAETASTRYAGFEHHAYPTCFTCGPARDDGLGIYAGAVAGRDGVVAAPWSPEEDLRPEIVWAALDCPAGWAVDDFQREGVLLGRMAASIHGRPEPGDAHVVIGWRVGEEGRKRFAGSALYTADGELVAHARSTWVVPATETGPAPTA